MPYMIGKAPIRRTLKYLKDWKVIFRDRVRIFSIFYNNDKKNHIGAKDFVFWHLPQIQYNNPTVQCVTFTNTTPTPFIQVYFDDSSSLLIDLDHRDQNDIVEHLYKLKAITKLPEELEMEKKKISKSVSSCFGVDCSRHCICEVSGQLPCPVFVPMPFHWRGIKKNKKLEIPPCFKRWGEEMKLSNEV